MASRRCRDQRTRSASWKSTRQSRRPQSFRFTGIQKRRRAEPAAPTRRQWSSCWRTRNARSRPGWASESFPRWSRKREVTSSVVAAHVSLEMTLEGEEQTMNADVLTTRLADGIAVITLGSARRIYFDAEMGDALTEALERFAGDTNVRVVVVTGGAPGYFIRHFTVAALIRLAESLRASGRQWPESATYNGGFFDKAMALCESMPKAVIAAISGTALAGGFEFALSCDLRIAEDGDYLIGLPEAELGLLPGAGGTQRLPRTIGSAAALMHILMGQPLNPRDAERKGLVHETVSGKAIDRAMEIAKRLSSHTPESLGYIKRLVRNATETPLAQGLALERNLFLKLCVSESALARMRSYEGKKITSPSRGFEV